MHAKNQRKTYPQTHTLTHTQGSSTMPICEIRKQHPTSTQSNFQVLLVRRYSCWRWSIGSFPSDTWRLSGSSLYFVPIPKRFCCLTLAPNGYISFARQHVNVNVNVNTSVNFYVNIYVNVYVDIVVNVNVNITDPVTKIVSILILF